MTLLSQSAIRVLVVDDTVVYRKIVSDVLAQIPGVEVVATAANGSIALQKIEQLHPDLITLDLEMPQVDGLEVLRRLNAVKYSPTAIMLSAFTSQGAQATLAALELGAFDFVLKPTGDNLEQNAETLRRSLEQKINAFRNSHEIKQILKPAAPASPKQQSVSPSIDVVPQTGPRTFGLRENPEIIVLGISTGGPQALSLMVPQLPGNLTVPILIVQHMPPMFTQSLAKSLNDKSPLNVCEAQDGQPVLAGYCLIAPGGKQMKVRKFAGEMMVQITDDPPENSCKPSVDYLFRSVAYLYGPRAMGVIMTGMGNDGTLGCRLMKREGATILAQNEATCTVYGMPRGPIEEGLCDSVVPLPNMAREIVQRVHSGGRLALCK